MGLMEKRIRPWVHKKIAEYIGEPEPTLTDFICSKVLAGSEPKAILEDVQMVLDEEAEKFWWEMNSPPTLLSQLLIFTVRACVSSVFCKTCSHVTVPRTVFEAVQYSSSLYSVSFISSCFIPNEIPIQSQS